MHYAELCFETSDTGSQYCCGRVGRGIQPPSTLKPTLNTQTYTITIENAQFPTFQLHHYEGRTNGPTDPQTNALWSETVSSSAKTSEL